MSIYMQYGDVRGDVTESTHTNWIELNSVNWGINRPVSNPAGSATARVIAAPRFSELVVAKDEDIATIPLIQESLAGEPKLVKIDFVRTDQERVEVYYSIELTDAVITGLSQGSGGDRPTESLTLNFTKISFHGTQMDADGSSTSPATYGWNVSNNAPA
ncbi:MAG: type VI secretion system tube protein Hcp [Alphaproteobacteria bacterium]|nr:type VI secretion system tube protein Hcp [Alphaproteobacteria bacterium]